MDAPGLSISFHQLPMLDRFRQCLDSNNSDEQTTTTSEDDLVQCYGPCGRDLNHKLLDNCAQHRNFSSSSLWPPAYYSETACITSNGSVDCGGGAIDEQSCIACVWSSSQTQQWPVPKSAVYGTLFVTGFIGNWFALMAIIVVKSLHTPTNFYLLNLSFSDMLLVLFGIPVELFSTWQQHPWIFGSLFCQLQNFVREFSTYLSVLTVVAFSVERYIAICHPFISLRASKRRAYKVIGIIWLLSILHALPALVYSRVIYLTYFDTGEPLKLSYACQIPPEHLLLFVYSLVISFILPFVVIIYVYAHIACVVMQSGSDQHHRVMQQERQSTLDMIDNNTRRRQQAAAARGRDARLDEVLQQPATRSNSVLARSLKRQTTNGSVTGGRRSILPTRFQRMKLLSHATSQDSTSTGGHRDAAKYTVLRMLFTVVIAFIICYGAFHCQRVLANLGSDWIDLNDATNYYAYQVMFFASCTLYFLHPTINPIVYCLHSQQFRRAFQQLLTCSTAECMLRKRRRRSGGQLVQEQHRAALAHHLHAAAIAARNKAANNGNVRRDVEAQQQFQNSAEVEKNFMRDKVVEQRQSCDDEKHITADDPTEMLPQTTPLSARGEEEEEEEEEERVSVISHTLQESDASRKNSVVYVTTSHQLPESAL